MSYTTKLENAQKFAADNVVDLAKELLDWRNTGILVNGKLTELEKLCSFGTHPLTLAEELATITAFEKLVQG